jgi:MtN3 and saliva related transmembrane protein
MLLGFLFLMKRQLTETIGFIAAILTTAAYVPQFLKVWSTRSTRDISLRMYLLMCGGVFLWLVYGIRVHSLPIILANGVTLGLTLAILGLKIRHR